MKGEVLRFLSNNWIDNLSPVVRLVAWIGVTLAIVLVADLALLIARSPIFTLQGTVGFVFLGTAIGYAGSAYRNRHNKNK